MAWHSVRRAPSAVVCTGGAQLSLGRMHLSGTPHGLIVVARGRIFDLSGAVDARTVLVIASQAEALAVDDPQAAVVRFAGSVRAAAHPVEPRPQRRRRVGSGV